MTDLNTPIKSKQKYIYLRALAQRDLTIKEKQDVQDESRTTVPETTYLPCYTSSKLEAMLREDVELGEVHNWVDDRKLPSRDEIAQVQAPACENSG